VRETAARLGAIGYPCGVAARTATLGDITEAMRRVYPDFAGADGPRRRIRSRLSRAAEEVGGVLLLDHFQDLGAASKGFLKSLWTLRVGILAVVDVEFPRDTAPFRGLKMTDETIALPRLDAKSMRRVFEAAVGERAVPRWPNEREWRALLRIAKGRPGWMERLAVGAAEARYWRDGGLETGLLRIDVAAGFAAEYIGLAPGARLFGPGELG